MATRGRNDSFYAIFSKYWWFQTKWLTGLLELVQLYKQNPLEKFFIFTTYQNYTLALNANWMKYAENKFQEINMNVAIWMLACPLSFSSKNHLLRTVWDIGWNQ